MTSVRMPLFSLFPQGAAVIGLCVLVGAGAMADQKPATAPTAKALPKGSLDDPQGVAKSKPISAKLTLTDEPELFAKAIGEMGAAFDLSDIPVGSLGSSYEGVEEMLKCVSRSETHVVQVYRKKKPGRSMNLVLVHGQTSGMQLLMGTDCSNAVLLDPINTSVIARATQAAVAKGKDVVEKTIVPVSLRPKEINEPGLRLSYQTALGYVSIFELNDRSYEIKVEYSAGQIIYDAKYDLVEHTCPATGLGKDCL